jgi:hypothetical protein
MKKLMLSAASGYLMLASLIFPAGVLADQTGIISDPACTVIQKQNQSPGQKQSLSGCTTKQKGIADAGGLLTTIIEGVIFVAAIIAVIFVMVGGINFIGSTGDPSRIARAKNTIQYAIIGLIIALLAQLIVSFVIGRIHS